MAEKRYLFTPGPTPVPPEVLAVIAQPIIHHRGSDFRALYERCLGRLREVFRTDTDVLMFAASGTGAMESAVGNLLAPGDRVVAVSAGPRSRARTAATSTSCATSGARSRRPRTSRSVRPARRPSC